MDTNSLVSDGCPLCEWLHSLPRDPLRRDYNDLVEEITSLLERGDFPWTDLVVRDSWIDSQGIKVQTPNGAFLILVQHVPSVEFVDNYPKYGPNQMREPNRGNETPSR